MRQLGMILGVVVLVAALIFLNKGIGKNAQPDTDDDAPQTQSQAQKPTPPPSAPVSDAIPPEQNIGNPATAKSQILVGWGYDASNQVKPDALKQALSAVAQSVQSHPSVSALIVNLDLPSDQRSPAARGVPGVGVYLNGKPLAGLSDNPGEGQTTAGHISSVLSTVLH